MSQKIIPKFQKKFWFKTSYIGESPNPLGNLMYYEFKFYKWISNSKKPRNDCYWVVDGANFQYTGVRWGISVQQLVVNCLMWMLGTELVSFVRGHKSFSCWAISPARRYFLSWAPRGRRSRQLRLEEIRVPGRRRGQYKDVQGQELGCSWSLNCSHWLLYWIFSYNCSIRHFSSGLNLEGLPNRGSMPSWGMNWKFMGCRYYAQCFAMEVLLSLHSKYCSYDTGKQTNNPPSKWVNRDPVYGWVAQSSKDRI